MTFYSPSVQNILDFWLTDKQLSGLQAPTFYRHRIYTHPRDISYFDAVIHDGIRVPFNFRTLTRQV